MMFLKPQRLVGFGNLTRTTLSSTRIIRAPDASAIAMTNTGHSFTNPITDTSTKMSEIIHIVLFQFKPEVSPETVLNVHWPVSFTLTRSLILLTRIIIGMQAYAFT